MSLSSTTLAALQQAGSAVYAADAALKTTVRDYAERVNLAMAANPFGLGNDALFDNWKLVARLSQTLAGIEEELKKVYQVACELSTEDGPSVDPLPALAAPTLLSATVVATTPDSAPTDVKVKRRKKVAKVAAPAPQAQAKRAAKSAKPAPTTQTAVSGNAAILLKHLPKVLNNRQFTRLNQSACAQATGIAAGSINAAVRKLLASGHLLSGPSGSFRLAA
jgi:hypothetical protein